MEAYLEFNPAFNPLSVKLICLLSSILPNEELIIEHPSVTFINNPEDMAKHTDILRYVHYSQPARSPFLPHHFFLPLAYISLEASLHATFPGRFRTTPYSKLSEVYSILQRKGKVK